MRNDWERRAKKDRTRLLCGRCSSREASPLKRLTIEPFSRWSSCSDLLEAFVDTLGERMPVSPCDEALASMVSGLLDGTGCAILRSGPVGERVESCAATGAWEAADLGRTLEEVGLEWASALGDRPMIVARKRDAIHLRVLRRSGRPSGTAVAFSVAFAGERVGAVLVTYDLRHAYGSSYLAAAKLLVGAVGVELANEQLRERSRRQSDWISRLRSDVERMGILLSGERQ